MKNILIIVPTYNEADNIQVLIASINGVFSKTTSYKADILFVDDNSPDGTVTVIESMIESYPNDIYIISGQKKGLGRAYRKGLSFAKNDLPKDYYAYVMMDADLSHDPKDISSLLKKLENGADCAVGSRYMRGSKTVDNYPKFRRYLSKAANRLASSLIDLDVDIKDLTSGFKALNSKSLAKMSLEDINASGYVFQVSMLFEMFQKKLVVQEVPITFAIRAHGKSKLRLFDIAEFVKQSYLLNPNSKHRRLLRFCTVGAIGAVVNLGVLVFLKQVIRIDVMPAYLIALEVSIISNFILNNWFTFKITYDDVSDRLKIIRTLLGKLLVFNFIALGGATIAWAVFNLFLNQFKINYLISDIAVIIFATGWNYGLSKRLVWRIVDNKIPEELELIYESQKS